MPEPIPAVAFEVGDRVVKNPDRWLASDFDSWGAGEGTGEVVAILFDGPGGQQLDIRWPTGLASQWSYELIGVPNA